MQIQVSGKHLDVGEALKTHIEDHLTDISEKYFDRPIESNVTLGKSAHQQIKADISVRVSKGITVQAHEEAGDAYAAFDGAVHKIARQLRKYKDRLKDHSRQMSEAAAMEGQKIVFSTNATDTAENHDGDAQPAVVAEMTTNIVTMPVSEAVMRMDLSNAPVIVFKNSGHGGLNVIYRREDGNISWIDPEGFKKAAN